MLTPQWERIIFAGHRPEEEELKLKTLRTIRNTFAEMLAIAWKQHEGKEHQESYERAVQAVVMDMPREWPGAPRIEAAAREAREWAFLAPGAPPADSSWMMPAKEFLTALDAEVEAAEKARNGSKRKDWAEWCNTTFRKGAGAIHRLTKIKAFWTSEAVRMPEGDRARDEGAWSAAQITAMQAQVREYKKHWKATGEAPNVTVPDRDCFERATAEQLRKVFKTFSECTAQSIDGTHPRLHALASDEGLECLAALYEGVERVGMWPRQVWYLSLPFIRKPKKGKRAILVEAGVVRGWEKLRQPEAEDFLSSSERDYWACGVGRSPEDVVWAQAVRSEAAAEQGEVSAAIFWDGTKYYEYFDQEQGPGGGGPPSSGQGAHEPVEGPKVFQDGAALLDGGPLCEERAPSGQLLEQRVCQGLCPGPPSTPL